MSEAASVGEAYDHEELSMDYDDACNEVQELAAELREAKIEVQRLRVRAQAVGRRGLPGQGSAGLAALPTPVSLAAEEQKAAELSGLLEWLAAHADLEEVETLDVGFEVPIGGRTVRLQQVSQWPLRTAPGGRLKLTVPAEDREQVSSLLLAAKTRGRVDPLELRAFAASWDFIAGQLTVAAQAEPSVLLAHKGSNKGILVATWPNREALQAFRTMRTDSRGGGAPIRVGERVEVEYEGTWYSGLLHSLDAMGNAQVKCDADPPGVMTITAICMVRRLPAAAASSEPGAAQQAVLGKVFSEEAAAADLASSAAAAAGVGVGPAAAAAPGPKPLRGHRRTRSSAL